MNIKQYILKSNSVLLLCFVITLIFNSFGRVLRWDLLQQIAMADNMYFKGYFYPNIFEDYSVVSAYFPGVSNIAYFFNLIYAYDYVVEILLIISILIFISFMTLLTKYANVISDTNHEISYYFTFFIIYLILVTPEYLNYAIEFKPDTISYLLGFLGLFLILKSGKRLLNYTGIFLIGLAILFKQQFISFTFGLFIFLIIGKKNGYNKNIFYSLLMSLLILIFLLSDEKIRFWNITTLSDDGFLSYKEIIKYSTKSLNGVLAFISYLLLLIDYDKNLMKLKISETTNNLINFFRNNPWPITSFFAAIFSLLSFIKVGGNEGNIQFSLILFLPLTGFLLPYFSKWKVILTAWLILLLYMPKNIYNSINIYNSALELKSHVSSLNIDNNKSILTGSNVYYASRILNSENTKIDDYWTYTHINNLSPYLGLKELLKSTNYDILIVENWNKSIIIDSKKYNIIFENDSGIIAKNINYTDVVNDKLFEF